MSIFFHEQLYRTDAVMAKLKEFPVTICGAGALGANLAENLARAGFDKLKVIDCDRIEERNLSTQPSAILILVKSCSSLGNVGIVRTSERSKRARIVESAGIV
ncbi:MAG TPA: ThiF family adenylyltransferase [Coleofasciculaceae cyanobacterium]|jgi:tRNA A37 threonylcarbamoyladenosine dehydratase